MPGSASPVVTGKADVPIDFYKVAAAGIAKLVTSWEEFRTAFGDIQADNSILAHAVYGFLNNGGTRCWVVRVVKGSDDGATTTALTKALEQFEAIDEIAMVAVAGSPSDAVQTTVFDHCERVPPGPVLDTSTGSADSLSKAAIKSATLPDSDFGALYFPWIDVFDPATNGHLVVPPTGHVQASTPASTAPAGCTRRLRTR